jgi:YD repeat-containing protein
MSYLQRKPQLKILPIFFAFASVCTTVAALALLPESAQAGNGYYKINLNQGPVTGATRQEACANAVSFREQHCPDTGTVLSSSFGWSCHFRWVYLERGQSCDQECYAGVCHWATETISSEKTCTAPRVYNSETQSCELIVEAKNEPPSGCESKDKLTENPVNLATGNKFIRSDDLNNAGSMVLEFRRHWNSYNKQWHFSYQQRAEVFSGNQNGAIVKHMVKLHRDSGRVVQFTLKSGVWAADADIRATLVEEASGDWLYTASSGDKERYNSSGQLIEILKVDGHGTTLTYGVNTVQVTDDYGNHIDLTLDSATGLVTSMTDPDDQVYRYDYNTDNHLEIVTFPADGSAPAPFLQYHYDSSEPGLITSITDENGDIYKTIKYDEQGRAIVSGLNDGSIGDSHFDYSLLEDPNDPQITVTNALGKQTTYHLEYHLGVVNISRIDGEAQAATNCLADAQRREYYPENGWLKRKTDKAGNKTYFVYETATGAHYGLETRRVEGEGSDEERVYEYVWKPGTRLLEKESVKQKRLGVYEGVMETVYTYYGNGRLNTRTETDLTNEADVLSRTWKNTYTYYDQNDVQVATWEVDGPRLPPIHDTTTYQYNTSGFLTRVTASVSNDLNLVTEYSDHNGRGQPRTLRDANGIETQLRYTARGWLDSVTQDAAAGGIAAYTDFHYDNVGQLTGITLADNVELHFRYDEGHRLEEVENELGELIKYTLDAAGNQDLVEYKRDATTVAVRIDYDFDGLNRLWKQLGSYGQATVNTYDENDHLTRINDGINPVTNQFFDAHNRVKRVIDAAGNDLLVEYGARDRIEMVADQRSLETTYVYDGYGNLQKRISPDTGVTTYDYDAADNRIKQTDARSVATNYTYDALNRLASVTYPDTTTNITYRYDNWELEGAGCSTCNGRLAVLTDAAGVTGYIYDALGRVDIRSNNVTPPGMGSLSLVTDFDYNAAGRLIKLKYPNGRTISYGFDDAGKINAVSYDVPTDPDGLAAIATDVAYQPFGPLKDITYANGLKLARQYDLDGRLDIQKVEVMGVGTVVQHLDYGYDLVNNIETIEDLVDPSRDEAFGYDSLNRLSQAAGKYGSIYYTYDEVGNRESRSITRGNWTVVEDYVYAPDSNRLQRIDVAVNDPVAPLERTFFYDNVGNITEEKTDDVRVRKFTYGDSNRLEKIEP